jgi:hypothetical protein
MAIQISITGLTTQQQQEVGNAFDIIQGRQDAGLTKAQWVERCIIRYIKAVVKGARRQAHETTLATEQAAVDVEYPEI